MRLVILIVACGCALAGCDGSDVLKPGDPPDTGADTGADTGDTAVASEPWLGRVEAFAEADAILLGAPWAAEMKLLGDLDGDGVGELGIVNDYTPREGIHLLTNPAPGTSDAAAATFAGFYSSYGPWWIDVSAVGDVNGDGLVDLVVTGDFDADDTVSDRLATCHLLLGPFEGEREASTSAALTITSDDSWEWFARSVALGDVDGDGAPDFAASALSSSGLGTTYVVPDDVSGGVSTADLDDRVVGIYWDGETLAAGDFDGDGISDLAIGAPESRVDYPTGAFHIVHLPITGTVDIYAGEADATVGGGERDGMLASSLDALGDVDGDGYGDLLVADPGTYPSVMVFRGPITSSLDPYAIAWATFVPADGLDRNPDQNVQSAGDVDGDGRSDVLLGAPYDNGAVFLYYGLEGGTLVIGDRERGARFTTSTDHAFGAAFAGGEDLDGDGLDDVAVFGWDYTDGTVAFFYGR